MIQKKTIEKYTKLIKEIEDSKLSINKYFKSIGKEPYSFFNAMSNIRGQAINGDQNAIDLIALYDSLNERSVSTNGESELGMKWWTDRNENGYIERYHIHYPIKDSIPFDTTLTRQDAETIFGLYTYYGGNVTARNVANEFPKYTLAEIKRIFRVFKLTKDSIFVPPHLIEELNAEELAQYRMQLKERAAFKYCDAKQERDFTNQIKKMASEINRLNDRQEIAKSLLGNIEYEKVTREIPSINRETTGIICLSDLHVGAFNVPEGYIDLPEYSESEINRRLDIIINSLQTKNWNKVIILNLGDNVDSYRKMTTSMTHQLPCILSDKQIAQMYLRVMIRFIDAIKSIFKNVQYISIGSGNHSGSWGWLLDITLSQHLQNIGINSYVSNNEIDSFDVNGTSFVYLHGKSDHTKGQFKGFPLNLNEKTQCWFNDFFADTNLKLQKRKVVLKGDLHQYSINSVSSFDYINCPSIYASSTYIVSNFGVTPWACTYLEVDCKGNYTTGLIRE